GFHTLVYTFTDANSCSNSASEVVYVDVCNGAEELMSEGFSVYPNPAHDFVTITVSNPSDVKVIHVYDLSGRMLLSEAVNNRSQIQLSLSNISSGVYVISAGTYSVKLVKE
ncbi:MAG: T9SS type A sorting domain-containing protein, partial [Bacteroidia bacterium]